MSLTRYRCLPPAAGDGLAVCTADCGCGQRRSVMLNKEYTEIESAFVSVAPFIALALSVKETVAATRGVPEITPVALSRVRPTGSIPDITDQV